MSPLGAPDDRSSGGASSVQAHDGAGQVFGSVGEEIYRQGGDLLGRNELAEGHRGKPALDMARDAPNHGSVGESRRDHVPSDVTRRKLQRQGSCCSMESRLGSYIGEPLLSRAYGDG